VIEDKFFCRNIIFSKLIFKLFIIFIIFIISLNFVFSSTENLDISNIFDTSIYSLKSDSNYTFTIDLNIENRIEKKLDFDNTQFI